MRFARVLTAAWVLAGFTLVACHEHRNAGPGERAGEKVDQGISKLGEKMQEGGQKLQDKAHGD